MSTISTVIFLIGFPLLVAIALLILKSDAARDIIVKVAAVAIIAASILLVVQQFGSGGEYFEIKAAETIGKIMMVCEVCLAIIIVVLGCKYKRFLAPVFAIIQTPLMIWFELSKGHHIAVNNPMYIDRLSMIMVLIIGIVGSLITVYAIGYMKDFQHHQKEGVPDRRPWFFFLMFLLLGDHIALFVLPHRIQRTLPHKGERGQSCYKKRIQSAGHEPVRRSWIRYRHHPSWNIL